ncbi:hypothetical protein [Burkholderia sp. Ac-20349]|uniref:hypothetical protein n=1 Tax=Burkholderia sp. Ac-20349 TaxID=2703893 RepID=UPI00197C650D|nr:hypothetical protein [Burkholderia sp. Ac-20349]MBN3839066.1 hypothetical protein [Burkholderia sp. Ac-20349]
MKPRLFSLGRLCMALGLFIPAASFAAIDLMPKEVTVDADTTSVQVVNNGDRPEYVTIALSRLLNPGVPLQDERVEPVAETKHPALYAYPFRMTLAPGQTKTITLKAVRAVETEAVYRLDVQPVIKVLGTEQKKTSANVVVNLGFSGLVRQLPAKPRESLAVECVDEGAMLTATGNVRVRVEGAKVGGHEVDGFNVYPGVPLPLKGHVVVIPGHPTCTGGRS